MVTRVGAPVLSGHGMRVVDVAPGVVETPLTRNELKNLAMRELVVD
jgi:NAD(P)-dependent dehydrogenase (short-subunit alcohol dehydrogenase family)